MNFCSQKEQPAAVKCRVAENEPGNLFFHLGGNRLSGFRKPFIIENSDECQMRELRR